MGLQKIYCSLPPVILLYLALRQRVLCSDYQTSTSCPSMWFEQLPPTCPPPSAVPPTSTFYRLTESASPTCDDFWSHRKLNPSTKYNTDECHARAVSVFNSPTGLTRLLKMERHRHKTITAIKLDHTAGLVEKNGGPDHYSWWRSEAFPILQNVQATT